MADQKISALAALVGANVVTSTDFLAIVDTSAAETKKILVSEMQIAIGGTVANQAQMETASTSTVTVAPSVQHFHPGMPKAWGHVTVPTTVNQSYPSAGVSVVKNGTGSYTVTFGKTMSANTYAVVVTGSSAIALSTYYSGKTVTTFDALFYDITNSLADPAAFSYSIFGDL